MDAAFGDVCASGAVGGSEIFSKNCHSDTFPCFAAPFICFFLPFAAVRRPVGSLKEESYTQTLRFSIKEDVSVALDQTATCLLCVYSYSPHITLINLLYEIIPNA